MRSHKDDADRCIRPVQGTPDGSGVRGTYEPSAARNTWSGRDIARDSVVPVLAQRVGEVIDNELTNTPNVVKLAHPR
jgi:hypothetical protein